VSKEAKKVSRRVALRVLGAGAVGAASACSSGGEGGQHADEPFVSTLSGLWRRFFQKHYRKMEPDEVRAMIERIEARYRKRYGREIEVGSRAAQKDTLYGYAISIDRCKGYRDCVHACVKENNLSREPEMQYIRVLELERGTWNLAEADPHYDHEAVPAPGHFYLPVQCFQCDNPPCVDVCPVKATWKDDDGIVVIDYQRCIGCRYCMSACPYWARRFNWKEAEIPEGELNANTHYLGNRPRPAGVVEKCTFCVHRVREGRQPACQEACPTGARVFGNLLDPDSEIRYVLENKTVFRLKEELGTEPKFWYFSG
jgi:molybdopterin-containing oxidoreductase family iron-sulfur binding subunit